MCQQGTMTKQITTESDTSKNRFENTPINRRDFMRLSAVTAGAIAFPGQALADVSSAKLTDLYEFAVNHTSEEYGVGTLLLLEDEDAFDELAALDLQEYHETSEPELAAYAQLDNETVEQVVDISGVVELQFSPGANPFWRLGHYDPRIFPPARDSVDYLDFKETVTGLQILEEDHSNRLDFYSIGRSPGWFNHALDEHERSDIWVAEVTNNINDEETFADKQKVIYSCSIHGDERTGAEAGTRFIENILEGDESEIETLLDEIVLIFLYTNPDGWNVRLPQYTYEGENPADQLEYKRGNSRVQDTNRQYPTAGWIDPAHFPAEPDGRNLENDQPGEIDADVPDIYHENVPDPLSIVHHFRSYENLTYVADLHEMGFRENHTLGLHVNTEYDLQQKHDIYDLNRKLKPRVTDLLEEPLREHEDLFQQHVEEVYDDPEDVPLPTEIPFDYGTIVDTLGYQTTGILVSWMGHPEEYGGLGAQTLAYEITNIAPRWPELMHLNVLSYTEVIRGLAEHAVQEIDATVGTGGRSTAFVTTDTLDRSSDELVFAASRAEHTGETVTVGPDPTPMTVTIEENARSVTFQIVQRTDAEVVAEVIAPDGTVRASYDTREDEAADARICIVNPEPGKWTVELVNPREDAPRESQVAVLIDTVVSEPTEGGVETPDPRDILGYEQREYETTPFAFFDAYDGYLDEGQFDAVTVDDVREGILLENGQLTYDNVVVIHDTGVSDSTYTSELDTFVNAGGNVLVTDTGVNLLAHMDNDRVSGISPEDLIEETVFSVAMNDYDQDHPLRADTRPIQRELYTPAPVGYPVTFEGEAPATAIDANTFEEGGGDVAGRLMLEPDRDTVSDWVLAGSFHDDGVGVHVIGGLLPPTFQEQLHPFGMLNHSVTFLGYTMLTNALGYDQQRFVDNEAVEFGQTILTDEQAQVYYPSEEEDEPNTGECRLA